MKTKVSSIFCCPNCKRDLAEKGKSLYCKLCEETYEVHDRIPVLVNLKNLPKHLNEQIQYFEKESVAQEGYKLYEWQKSYVNRFLKNFTDVKDKTIIDCGAGSGYMTIELARRGAFVIACDLNLKGLLKLQQDIRHQGMANRVSLVCCSADALPLKNRIADYFISNAVLEHLPQEKKAIKEINRVTRNSAGIMVTVPLQYRYIHPLLIVINYIHDKRIGHLRRYDMTALVKRFKDWKLSSVYYTGHTWKVIKTLINMMWNIFDEQKIEKCDAQNEHSKWSASNIICFFKK